MQLISHADTATTIKLRLAATAYFPTFRMRVLTLFAAQLRPAL
jgi:hypothetical protein